MANLSPETFELAKAEKHRQWRLKEKEKINPKWMNLLSLCFFLLFIFQLMQRIYF